MLAKPIHFGIWQFKLFQTRPQDKWLYDRVTQAQWQLGGKKRRLLPVSDGSGGLASTWLPPLGSTDHRGRLVPSRTAGPSQALQCICPEHMCGGLEGLGHRLLPRLAVASNSKEASRGYFLSCFTFPTKPALHISNMFPLQGENTNCPLSRGKCERRT